jgi:hypothetical protein
VAVQVEHHVLVAEQAASALVAVACDPEASFTRDVDDLHVDRRVRFLPRHDRGRHAARRARGREAERTRRLRGAAVQRTPRHVVRAIAGRRVVGRDVLRLAEVLGVREDGRVDVVLLDLRPLVDVVPRLPLERVGVDVRAGERVDLGARAEAGLRAVEARAVRVGAADTETRARAGRLAGAAEVLLERGETVLEPALAQVLEAPVVQAVDVLPDDRVLVVARDPVELGVPDVAGRRAQGVGADVADRAVGRAPADVPDDDVGAGRGVGALGRRRARESEEPQPKSEGQGERGKGECLHVDRCAACCRGHHGARGR